MVHLRHSANGTEPAEQPRSFMSLGLDQALQEVLLSVSAARFQARPSSFSFRIALPDGTTSSLLRDAADGT